MTYWTCYYCGANLDPGEKCDCDGGALRRDDKIKNENEEKENQK